MKTNNALLMMFALMMIVLAACSAPVATSSPPTASDPLQAPPTAPTAAPTHFHTETPAAATEAPAEPAALFPTGRFVSMKDKAFSLRYNEDGTFGVYLGNTQVVDGTYSVDGNQISIISPADNDPKCQGSATYEWFFDGENLTFAPSGEDTCKARRDANEDTYVLAADALPEITIDAADYSYTAPETVSAGWVRVSLTNSGQEPHHVQFLRLNDGVTVGQFEEALKQGEGPALALTKQVGGVGAIAPTMTAHAVLNLPAGNYVILCFIPSPTDGAPHHAKGMIKSLTVQPTSDAAAGEPSADLTVHLMDYTFDLPEALPAGQTTIKVVNDGPEPHEFNLLRLADGKTLEDVIQFMTASDGPPPFTPIGGMNGLDVGLSGYAEIYLQPGTYAAICNIPSPKAEGHPHSMLGMIKQFTVGATETSN
jgi:hypothetical protein